MTDPLTDLLTDLLTDPPRVQVPELEGVEGDSVTRLHQDMSDAINVMLHCQGAEDWLPRETRSGLEPSLRGTG